VFFNLFFFANFDHTTIIYLVSDFTCFLLVLFIIFTMGMGLRGSILFNSGTFDPNFGRW